MYFVTEIKQELTGHILPFWRNLADVEHGGFFGAADMDLAVHREAEKGGIAAARHLWSWSAAARRLGGAGCRETADLAYTFLRKMIDTEHGGLFWMARRDGTPTDTRKHVYAQAFAIYALSEYHRLTGAPEALTLAMALFALVERAGYSKTEDRYLEEFDRAWTPLPNLLVGEKLRAETTTNTHLHVLEAYTNLYLAGRDARVGERLSHLTDIFRDKIYSPERHCFDVFFDARWRRLSPLYSFGHDIEATWLLWDAYRALGRDGEDIRAMLLDVAGHVRDRALLPNGFVANEEEDGVMDKSVVWWVQAEAMVGFVNAFSLSQDSRYLDAALRVWDAVKAHIIDKRPGGEWYYSLNENLVSHAGAYVGGPWKTPYHNARSCLELIDRLSGIHGEYFARLRAQEALLTRENGVNPDFYNGVYTRHLYPVVTRDHLPLHWRYDLNAEANPLFLERLGINAAFNSGALYKGGLYHLAVRVEGADRKSFFAVAQSEHPTHGFRFVSPPVAWDKTPSSEEVNVYDMRLTAHEDGNIYGVFCSESHDDTAPKGDTSSAVAAAGLARTRDLLRWERLPNLRTPSPQQRNVVLHPAFVNGRYAFYTRPQDGFIETGGGGGIAFGLCGDMERPSIETETLMDEKRYHTVYEVKNGLGPAPLQTEKGWLHLAHGVRNTAAGLRYVLYCFLSELDRPWVVTHKPGGALLVPLASERVGDVSNVAFSNGWVMNENEEVYIYYASSDTRLHVAGTTLRRLLDYVLHTPEDPLNTSACVSQRAALIGRNMALFTKSE